MKLTFSQVDAFLEDFEQNSEVYFLTEGKKKDELLESASKRGIIINSKIFPDLGVIKLVYGFAGIANKNKDRLPIDEFKRAYPRIVGRPLNINHNRKFIVGFYIDYKYIEKEKMAIAYAIFFKSAYPELWQRIQHLHKIKKLAHSYEVVSPDDKIEVLEDGTRLLHGLIPSGGALILRDEGIEPAFSGAVSLKVAKKCMNNYCLTCASEVKDKDVYFKTIAETFNCECPICGYKTTSESHCNAIICPKCQKSTLRREERPGTGLPNQSPNAIPSKIKCSNCQAELDLNVNPEISQGQIKCPECKAILNRQTGQMLYPPQIKNFKTLCPSCKVDDWLIVSAKDVFVNVKCRNCNKEYEVEFNAKKEDVESKIFAYHPLIYQSSINCIQCGRSITISNVSSIKFREVSCKNCGITFPLDINNESNKKSVKRIREIKMTKASVNKENVPKGGNEVEGFKITLSKFHRYIDTNDFENFEKDFIDEENLTMTVSAKLPYEKRKELKDSDFAVVVRVKNKKTGKIRKIRKYPINDEAHVRNALSRLGQDASKKGLQELGIKLDDVLKKVLQRAKQLKMYSVLLKNEDDCNRLGISIPKVKATEEAEAELAGVTARYLEAIKRVAKKFNKVRADNKKKIDALTYEKENLESDLIKITSKLEKANKKITLTRRTAELGDWANEMTPEEILDTEKYKATMAKKKKEEEKLALHTATDENVGDGGLENVDEDVIKRQKIDASLKKIYDEKKKIEEKYKDK